MAMMASIRREERIGLAVAFGLHVALVLAFLSQPDTREDIEPAQRMTVNLASEVGLEATAPVPVPESRAAIAPTLADTPAPAPQPTPQPRLERPVAASAPSTSRPRPQPSRVAAAPPRSATKGGGSRVGDNFLAGMGDSTRTSETRAPAGAIGASERASLLQAITNKIRPHWSPPSGPDVDQITTYVRFRLNPDGSLAGRPTTRQSGVTDTNRSQSGRHAELAVRAVMLAAPFSNLPEKYYEAWKSVGPIGFNLEL